jgi:glutamate dehydrogenase/leucine dehydrogenase
MLEYDEFGPEKVLTVYDAKLGMRGFVVIDSTALGPGKGGIRMTPFVSVEEVAKLARTMTWKNALAELPLGGAKSGIVANDKNISRKKKREMVRAFSRALKDIAPKQYIAAPDMNMGEKEMEWFVKANGSLHSATGKPAAMGGLPHELGSTGFGVYQATMVAAKHKKIDLRKATFAVEGFGNVGIFASQYLTEHGAKMVAVSDSRGVMHSDSGIDFRKMVEVKRETGSVTNYKGSKSECDSILDVKADILITAAIPDLIKAGDVDRLKFKLIVEGSNIPMTEDVEELVHKKGILVVPDFVANAGGVISSYVEYLGGDEKQMFEMIEQKISKNTRIVLEHADKRDVIPRHAAMEIAKERVRKG